MKNIWKFLNSPLIVVLIALLSWPLFLGLSGVYAMKIGMAQMVQSVKSELGGPLGEIANANKQLERDKASYSKFVVVENSGFGISSYPSQQKVIATVKNTGTKSITSIHVLASYYDASGKLIDVDKEWLGMAGSFLAGTEKNITINHATGLSGESEEDKNKSAVTVKVEVANFDFLE